MKIASIIVGIFTIPGMVLGTISSYRAGQKPHRDLYRQLQKFTHRKK